MMSLTLNAFDIITNKEEVIIYRTDFEPNVIRGYIDSFVDWAFKRDGNFIYAWPYLSTPAKKLPDGFKEVKISRDDNTLIYNSIIEESIARYFRIRNHKTFKVKYTSHWEVVSPTAQINIDGLKAYQVLNFHIQPCFSVTTQTRIAKLVVLIKQKYIFELNNTQFAELRVDTKSFKKNQRGEIVGSRDNIKYFVEVRGKLNEFNDYIKEKSNDNYLYGEIKKLYDFFSKKILKNIWLPDGLEITNYIWNNIPDNNFENQPLPKTIYHFHNDRTDASGAYQERIKKLKPTSYDQFFNKEVRAFVLCPNDSKGSMESFMISIKQILKETFHLYRFDFVIDTFDPSTENYVKALERNEYYNYQIGIIAFYKSEKLKPPKNSYYYITKAKFLNQRIPTQDVIIENVRKDSPLIIDAVALNIYSKIGGIAWTVAKTQLNQNEVIVGISSFEDEEKNNWMGYANIFDFNGSYLLGDCCQLSNRDDYKQNLKKYLIDSITQIIKDKSVDEVTPLRLIFHLTKEAAKKYEIDAIDSALVHFKNYKIEYAIVHLSYGHNLRILKDEGRLSPERGTYIQISTLQALLHLGDNSRIPILIRLDKRSSFKDLFELSKQVLFFSHLCYRNYKPATEPVTIKYPALMLRMTNQLDQIPDWDKSLLNNLKDQLWFI